MSRLKLFYNKLNNNKCSNNNTCEECKQGACCLESECIITTSAECLSLGGNYLGDDTLCEDCPIPSPSPSCEPICISVSEAQYDLPPKYDCDVIEYNIQTINIPEGMTPPVTVVLTGNADDLLMIDGQVVDAGQADNGGCPVNARNYTFTLNSNSFTISSGDTIGLNSGYNYDICFYNIDCPIPSPSPPPGYPVSVILSNFSGFPENCSNYNGTYIVYDQSDYNYPVEPPNNYVTDASVDVGYDPNNDNIYICLNITTPDGSSQLCQQYDVDWNTGNYTIAFGGGFPSTPWCVGDIALEFSNLPN